MAEIVEVGTGTELLASVRRLWRSHSQTLGYLPEGAFDEHARGRSILAATEGAGEALGYVLFRVTGRRQAVLVHLCIAPGARGRGIARQLFEAVRARVGDCNDIVARCRRDFDADRSARSCISGAG